MSRPICYYELCLKIARVPLVLMVALSSFFCLVKPPIIPNVLAQYTWTDTLNVFHNITTFSPNIRNITNTYSYPIEVKVSLIDVDKISLIRLYKIVGNNTDFIYIKDGSTIRPDNTFSPLQPGQTLVFNIYAKPSNSLSTGETITVTQKVELFKVAVAPVYPPPLIIPKPPKMLLDIKVYELPAIVYLPFQTRFHAKLLLINKGTAATDVKVKWWVTDTQGTVYPGGETTVFISGLDKKYLEIDVVTPPKAGNYTLHAKTTEPVVVTAESTFVVQEIPWLYILLAIAAAVVTVYLYHRRKR